MNRLPVVLVAVGLVLALAACGGTKPKPAASSDPQLALAECMRAHGVTNFPDPIRGSGGEGFTISQPVGGGPLSVNGIAFSGPVFTSAEKTCKLFGGGTKPPPVSESQKLALFKFAACMRAHGVPGYPDPVFPAGGGIQQRNFPPGVNPDSPAFQQAAKACGRD
jgi:hypothetical protein